MDFADQPKAHRLPIRVRFGANARVERRLKASLLEQPPSLLPNLHPLLVGLSVAPFVEQTPTDPEHLMSLVKNSAPVRRQIQEPSDHDGVETSRREWKSRSLGDNHGHGGAGGFGAELGQHVHGRVGRDDMAPMPGKRDRDSPGPRVDVKHARARPKPSSLPQAFQPFVR